MTFHRLQQFELILLYVDDILYCLQNPKLIMDVLSLTFDMKDGSVGPQTVYLGAEIKKYQVKIGKSYWSTASAHYMKNFVKMVEGMLNI